LKISREREVREEMLREKIKPGVKECFKTENPRERNSSSFYYFVK
jgi:hypothetical protein